MAAEHHSAFDGQSTDVPALASLIQGEDVDHRHEAIRRTMDGFMDGDGYSSGKYAVDALDRDAAWGPCPGVIVAVALRMSTAAPVT